MLGKKTITYNNQSSLPSRKSIITTESILIDQFNDEPDKPKSLKA